MVLINQEKRCHFFQNVYLHREKDVVLPLQLRENGEKVGPEETNTWDFMNLSSLSPNPNLLSSWTTKRPSFPISFFRRQIERLGLDADENEATASRGTTRIGARVLGMSVGFCCFQSMDPVGSIFWKLTETFRHCSAERARVKKVRPGKNPNSFLTRL